MEKSSEMLCGCVELFFTVEKAYRLLCKICVKNVYFDTMKEYIEHSIGSHRTALDTANLTEKTINNHSVDCHCVNNEPNSVNLIIQPSTGTYQVHCCICEGHYVFDNIEDFISHSLERHREPMAAIKSRQIAEVDPVTFDSSSNDRNLETSGTVSVLGTSNDVISQLENTFENILDQGQQVPQLFETLLLPNSNISFDDYDGSFLTEVSYMGINFLNITVDSSLVDENGIENSKPTTDRILEANPVEDNSILGNDSMLVCEVDLNQNDITHISNKSSDIIMKDDNSLVLKKTVDQTMTSQNEEEELPSTHAMSMLYDICSTDAHLNGQKMDITEPEVTVKKEDFLMVIDSMEASGLSSQPMKSEISKNKSHEVNGDIPSGMQNVDLTPPIKKEENASFEKIIGTDHINNVTPMDINIQLPLNTVKNETKDVADNTSSMNASSKENTKSNRKRKAENLDKERSKKIKTDKKSIDTINCEVCSKLFTRSSQYEMHKKQTHPSTECRLCNRDLQNVQEMLQHLKIHSNEVQCPLCNERNVWYAEKHLKKHFILLSCNKCEFFTCDKNILQTHQMTCGKFVCNICNEVCKDSITYRRHALSSHGNREPFECVRCQQKFRYVNAMTAHQKLCKGEKGN